MVPAEVGERIGMPAKYAGRCLYWMLGRGLVEKPDKEKALYRITQKGKDYRANPPKEPPGSVGKVVEKDGGKDSEKVDEKVGEKVEKDSEKSEEEKKEEDGLIPSAA